MHTTSVHPLTTGALTTCPLVVYSDNSYPMHTSRQLVRVSIMAMSDRLGQGKDCRVGLWELKLVVNWSLEHHWKCRRIFEFWSTFSIRKTKMTMTSSSEDSPSTNLEQKTVAFVLHPWTRIFVIRSDGGQMRSNEDKNGLKCLTSFQTTEDFSADLKLPRRVVKVA